jgi:hypothetical protein
MLLLTSKSVTLQQKATNESSGFKFLQYIDKLSVLIYQLPYIQMSWKLSRHNNNSGYH